MRLSSRLMIGVALLAVGCPRTPPPPPPPLDGGNGDGSAWDFEDADGDGLCNRSESMLGTDPTLSDSDGDGFADRAEVELGYEPTRTDSPDRAFFAILNESRFSTTTAPIVYTTPSSTTGRSFEGAFGALPSSDPDGVDASFFFADALAVGADPSANVFQVVPEEERFLGVNGRTELFFEASFAFGDNAVRSCARAYPWRYLVRSEDGTTVSADRFLLVVVPEAQTLETAAWCLPAGSCI